MSLKDHLDNHHTFRLLYADDLQIHVQVPDHCFDQGIAYLSESAQAVAKWATCNSLSLNTKKTQTIVFGSPHTLKLFKKLNIPDIKVNSEGDSVQFLDAVTSLGVILDSTLTWIPQVQLYCFLSSYRPHYTLLVVPHLDYCCLVYSYTSKKLSEQLQRLSNSCIRYVYGITQDEHITP